MATGPGVTTTCKEVVYLQVCETRYDCWCWCCCWRCVTTMRLSTWSGTYTGSLTTTASDACDRRRYTSGWYPGRGSAQSAIVRFHELCVEGLDIFCCLSEITCCFQEEIEDPTLSAVLQSLTSTRSNGFNLLLLYRVLKASAHTTIYLDVF